MVTENRPSFAQAPEAWSTFAQTIMQDRYAWTLPDGRKETWPEVAHRVASNVMGAVKASNEVIREVEALIANRVFMPGGRYLAASGRPLHQTQNCALFRAEDTREGWADLLQKCAMALMTGAGVGVVYSDLRAEGAPLKRTQGYASGPIALMQAVNEVGRAAKSGGSRRAAIWAGLAWDHPDTLKFIRVKDWPEPVKKLKEQDFNFPATLDHTNISVILDDAFFRAFARGDTLATEVFWETIRNSCETGDPGFSVNCGKNAGEDLRNACAEITSMDDSDVCNLGSINLARVNSLTEMKHAVEIGTMFLLAGTVYSDLPHDKMHDTRKKNRRLGLGLMGIAEKIAINGGQYGDMTVLEEYLYEYLNSTYHAQRYAGQWNLSCPVKTRAIAPTGTIGIVAETTTGLEPILCSAYRRRYYNHGKWDAQYVIDPTARRLVQAGVSPDKIEDAYSLATDTDRRVGFQANVQQFVDHAISSTVNLPPWGSKHNNPDTIKNFGHTMLKWLPHLRGLTVYPDGARGGQPLSAVDFREALQHEGKVFTETPLDICELRGGGSCGA